MSDPLTHRALIAPAFLPDAEPDEGVVEQAPEAPPKPRTGEATPAGEALADVIASGLQSRGWTVDYRWTTYQGHALDARRDDHRYDVEVDLLDKGDEGTGRWLVTAKRRAGFFKKVFQGGVDVAEHEMLRRDIDATLAADARVSGPVVWVDEANWRG